MNSFIIDIRAQRKGFSARVHFVCIFRIYKDIFGLARVILYFLKAFAHVSKVVEIESVLLYMSKWSSLTFTARPALSNMEDVSGYCWRNTKLPVLRDLAKLPTVIIVLLVWNKIIQIHKNILYKNKITGITKYISKNMNVSENIIKHCWVRKHRRRILCPYNLKGICYC